MLRDVIGMLALTMVVIAPTSLWADDERSDAEIGNAIVQALQAKKASGELKDFQIGVRVAHGDVWLDGEVTTPEQQKMVLDIARHIPGVLQVVNDLKLVSPEAARQTVEEPSDDDLSPSDETPPLAEVFQAGRKSPPDKLPHPPDKLPHPPKKSPLSEKQPPTVMPASATGAPPAPYIPTWQPRGKRIADKIVQAIESKRESGKLRGFDVVVHIGVGRTVYLQGRVANDETRAGLLKTVRAEPEITDVHDLMTIAEEGAQLPDKATPHTSNIPTVYPKTKMSWDDDWWMLDFKTKKHR